MPLSSRILLVVVVLLLGSAVSAFFANPRTPAGRVTTFTTDRLVADPRPRLAATQSPSKSASHTQGNRLGERAQFLFDNDATASSCGINSGSCSAAMTGSCATPCECRSSAFCASQSSGGEVWFPAVTRRPRRNRRSETMRALVRESDEMKDPRHLVYPLFIEDTDSGAVPIASMPGCLRHSRQSLVKEVKEAFSLGVRSFILFPHVPPSLRSNWGEEAYNPDGLVPRAIQLIKEAVPAQDTIVMTDIALDPYSSEGHDGVVGRHNRHSSAAHHGKEGEVGGIDDHRVILNDVTLLQLQRQAVCHALAGADIVAPSDMMDGRIGAVRWALDRAGFAETVGVMAYSAKYASSFYGPFRDALHSHPGFGDKKTYQQDPCNSRESELEAELDVAEGADILLVKPGMPYLDIVHRLRTSPRCAGLPVAAYQVSGEYSMIKAAAEKGFIDEKRVVLESMNCFRRAGADIILTYFAKDVAKWLA